MQIENMSINEIEEIMKGMSEEIAFLTRTTRCCTVEEMFENENIVKNMEWKVRILRIGGRAQCTWKAASLV